MEQKICFAKKMALPGLLEKQVVPCKKVNKPAAEMYPKIGGTK